MSIIPKINQDLNNAQRHFRQNKKIITTLGGDLSRGQAQDGVSFEF